jgi:uncharacterized protein YjbI with pentapeptide repeats
MNNSPTCEILRALVGILVSVVCVGAFITALTGWIWKLGPERLRVQLSFQNEVVRTIVQIVALLAVILGGYMTYQQLGLARKQQAQERERDVTGFFDRAVGNFDAQSPSTRIGDALVLERVAENSEADRSRTVRFLAGWLRTNSLGRNCARETEVRSVSPTVDKDETARDRQKRIVCDLRPLPQPDLDAITGVLARLLKTAIAPAVEVNLRDVDLRWTHLPKGGSLEFAELGGARLTWSIFKETHIAEANFTRSCVDCSFFWKADVSGTEFNHAELRFAEFDEAVVGCRDLDSRGPKCTDFKSADLRGATFSKTDLATANFDGANLSGADLSEARNLSESQLAGTCGDEETRLPSGIKPLSPCRDWRQANACQSIGCRQDKAVSAGVGATP